MIDSIHQSDVNLYLRCQEQFRRVKILGERVPPKLPASRGQGLHAANKANLTNKIITGNDLSLSDLKDACRDGFVDNVKDGIYLSKPEQGAKRKLINEALNEALTCTEIYKKKLAPEMKPIAVEEKFNIDIGLPVNLEGTKDYEEHHVIGDLKSSTNKWPIARFFAEIQPVFYSLCYEIKEGVRPTFWLDVFTVRGAFQPVKLKVSDRQYRGLKNILWLYVKGLQSGLFQPTNPVNWWCAPKYCGFWYSCKYVGN